MVSCPEQPASSEQRRNFAFRKVVVGAYATHLFGRPEHQWDALVQRVRDHIKDRVDTVGGPPPGAFDHKSYRCTFVNQAEPASVISGPCIRRVEKDAAAFEDTMRFSHQRSDPTHVEILAIRTIFASDAVIDERPYWWCPMTVVRGVYGKLASFVRYPQLVGHRNKLTVMKNELVNMVCGCHDEAGLRPVNYIARCDLLPAGAAEALPPAFLCIENREYGPDRNVRIDIG